MSAKPKREQWKSRLGFIWAAVGSAVGLGSIWLFPYEVGKNGGAAYVLLYLICLLLVGFPVLMSEILIGRSIQRNPADSFYQLGKHCSWKGVGMMTIGTGFLVSCFYSVIAGWTLGYLIQSVLGQLSGLTSATAAADHFADFSRSIFWPLGSLLAFLGCSLLILATGVRQGIEKGSQIMMPVLLLLLIFLAVKGVFMPGGGESIRFMFQPDFSRLTPKAILLALGQAFFALSLGQGTMVTYGSYLSKRTNLPGTCIPVAVFGIFIALLAGIAIFAIVFSFGLPPTSGEGLMFQTLPLIFAQMAGGYLLAILFFLLLVLAALTSQISAMEPLIAYFIDVRGWRRKKAVLVTTGAVFLLATIAALSFGPLHRVTLFGNTFFDLLFSLCIHVFIPLGGLGAVLLVGWRWGMQASLKHLKQGAEGVFKNYPFIASYFRLGIKIIAPGAIVLIMLDALGLISLFH
ncbi:MAG: sodium-dependent transporter [Chlamydiota bacterium]